MGYDDDFIKQRELFMSSIQELNLNKIKETRDGKESTPKYRIDPQLANDVFSYIWRQVNDFSNKAVLNEQEYQMALSDAWLSLFILVFVTNYSEDNLEKEPLFVSGRNLLCLKYSEVYQGRTRQVELAKIAASQPVSITR